jgi:hypothetical protein
LITIIVLVVALIGATIYQIVLAGGERRFPGGPIPPPSASP